MNKQLTFLLSLTFLFLFSGSSVVFGIDPIIEKKISDAGKKGDYQTVLNLLAPLAEKGDPDAQTNLGFFFEQSKDYREAFKLYRLSARQGNTLGMYNLGNMYANGTGVKQDNNEAVKWIKLAAEKGLPSAFYNLGGHYRRGQGVEKNYEIALKFYWIASKLGHVNAKQNLGVMYVKGMGVERNYVIGYMLFDIADSEGHASSINARDQTALKMLPQQIEEAKEKVKKWNKYNWDELKESVEELGINWKPKDYSFKWNLNMQMNSYEK
jgi:uncharacterized protein